MPSYDSTVDIPLGVDANSLGTAVVRGCSLWIFDEVDRHAVPGAPNAEAFPPSRVIGARLRVGDVHHVVLRNPEAARPSELFPGVEQLAVLIENLDPVVLAIADEQPALRIERDRVRLADLIRAVAFHSPLFEVGAVLAELHDSAVRRPAVTVGDEDVAVVG